eukprot:1157566-Pelagomonas_calceolata.AAC.9
MSQCQCLSARMCQRPHGLYTLCPHKPVPVPVPECPHAPVPSWISASMGQCQCQAQSSQCQIALIHASGTAVFEDPPLRFVLTLAQRGGRGGIRGFRTFIESSRWDVPVRNSAALSTPVPQKSDPGGSER